MKLEDFRHHITMSLRWSDEDMLAHLNNLVYMQFAEEGRVRYFHDVFPKSVQEGFWDKQGVILADIQCSFLKQVNWPAELTVGTRIARLGNSSADLINGLFLEGELVARLKSVIVWMNYQENRSEAWPQVLKDAVRQYEPVKVEG